MALDPVFSILPGNCLLCRKPSRRRLDLCAACEHDLPALESACRTCAIPLPSGDTCGECLKHPPPQNAARAAFVYGFPVDRLIQRFKFNNAQAAGRVLQEIFAARVPAMPASFEVLPVPLHPRRLRERGFNQAEMLAHAIGKQLGLRVRNDVLERTRDTAVQSNMSAAARRRNVRNAFSVTTRNVPGQVIVIDDVITTGSTTNEIARLLRKAGVAEIETWALARTPFY